MNNKLISLIIPIYNAEKYLSNCIDSILNQTYSNIEVVLVNDGSTDRSGEICEEIKAEDSRVKVIHQKNSGPSAARNAGVLKSKGDYLQFVDADDHIESIMVEKLLSVCENEVDLVLCGYYINGEEVKENIPDDEGMHTLTEFISKFPVFFKKNLINSPGNKLYRTKIIKDNAIKFNKNINNGEDLLFNIEYIKHCRSISLVNLSLYHYNILTNPLSLTKKYKEGFFKSRKIIFKSLEDLLCDYTKEFPYIKKTLEETYSQYVIWSMTNVFHAESQLNRKEKREYLSEIIEDKWVKENIALIEKKKPLGIIIRFLLRNKFVYILSLSINLGFIIKNTLKVKLM